MEPRVAKALHIAAVHKLAANNGHWRVPSQSGNGTYMVVVGRDETFHCSCPDYETRLMPCKHVMAIEFTIRRETGKDPKLSFSETVKITYSQDWAAYNAAKTGEKDMFVRLLADLVRAVPQPEQRTGRPRLPMADMAFACVYKTYSRFPSRRLACDLRAMETAGHITSAGSFNSLSNYMRSPAMEAALHQLIQLSAMPLAAIETEFAVDSSGFGTANLKTWFSQKHGKEMTSERHRFECPASLVFLAARDGRSTGAPGSTNQSRAPDGTPRQTRRRRRGPPSRPKRTSREQTRRVTTPGNRWRARSGPTRRRACLGGRLSSAGCRAVRATPPRFCPRGTVCRLRPPWYPGGHGVATLAACRRSGR